MGNKTCRIGFREGIGKNEIKTILASLVLYLIIAKQKRILLEYKITIAFKIRNWYKVKGRLICLILNYVYYLGYWNLKLRMERLELSKQKLLGPKSSASTNFATSVSFLKS